MPSCPICKNDYDRKDVRPHIISECAHSMCLKCCKASGKCGTCNSAYNKNGEFKVAHDMEQMFEEMGALRRVRNQDVNVSADLMERLFMTDNSAPTSNDEVPVFVRNLEGKSIKMEVKLTDKVSVLKQEIKCYTGMAVEQQRLLFGGKQLEDQNTLASYNIKKAATIELVARAKGGIVDEMVSQLPTNVMTYLAALSF